MQEKPELSSTIRKAAIQPGVILGVVMLVLSVFTFYFITEIASSYLAMVSAPFVLGIIIPIIIAVFMMIDIRKKIGGFWTFKQATSAAFVLFMVAYLISFIGNTVYTKVINKDVTKKMATVMIDGTSSMLERQGLDQSKIDETVRKMEQQFKEQEQITVSGLAKGLLTAVLMYFILSLIFGAIFKREGVRRFPADSDVEPV